MRKPGLTLVELIIALAIISALAALGVNSFNRAKMQARDANRRLSVRSYSTSMDQWKTAKGSYFVELPASYGTCTVTGQFSDGDPVAPHKAGMAATGDACVGFRGGSVGQITRTNRKGLARYTDSSIAQALFEQGYIEKIATDPLDKDFGTKSERDFILTLCMADSAAPVTKADAVQFAIFANLEGPKPLEASVSKVHCGGKSTPFGWDTLVYTK